MWRGGEGAPLKLSDPGSIPSLYTLKTGGHYKTGQDGGKSGLMTITALDVNGFMVYVTINIFTPLAWNPLK